MGRKLCECIEQSDVKRGQRCGKSQLFQHGGDVFAERAYRLHAFGQGEFGCRHRVDEGAVTVTTILPSPETECVVGVYRDRLEVRAAVECAYGDAGHVCGNDDGFERCSVYPLIVRIKGKRIKVRLCYGQRQYGVGKRADDICRDFGSDEGSCSRQKERRKMYRSTRCWGRRSFPAPCKTECYGCHSSRAVVLDGF